MLLVAFAPAEIRRDSHGRIASSSTVRLASLPPCCYDGWCASGELRHVPRKVAWLAVHADLGIAGRGDADAAAARYSIPESPTAGDNADEPTRAFSPGYVDAGVSGQPDFRRLRLDPIVSKEPCRRAADLLLSYRSLEHVLRSPRRVLQFLPR